MDKVVFLLWYSNLAIGEKQNNLIASFLEKASRLIEDEINAAGGVAGAEMEIRFKHIDETGKEAINRVIDEIVRSPEILLTNGTPFSAHKTTLMESPALNNVLVFYPGGAPGSSGSNINISRASQITKARAANHILVNQKGISEFLFLHDGKRIADHEATLADQLPAPFISEDLGEYSDPADIDKRLEPIFSRITNDTGLILDIGLSKYKKIYDYLNDKKMQTRVVSVFGSIEGRFPQIGFSLVQITGENFFPTLEYEDLVRQVGLPLTTVERALVLDSSWRLETPLLAAHAARHIKGNISQKKEFLSALSESVEKIDGVRDFFVGKRLVYAFKGKANFLKTTYCYQFPHSLQEENSYPKIFYPQQIKGTVDEADMVGVNFVYIDILRVTNIDIGRRTWTAEFYLDVVSLHDHPTEIIQFRNLSALNPKLEVKPVWNKQLKGEQHSSYRYTVVANFDFGPLVENFPFDWQYIFISFGIVDEDQFGVIAPIPEEMLDKEFEVSGWDIRDSVSGIRRQKTEAHEGSSLQRTVRVTEETRVGWILSRQNTSAILKVGIPLFFLLFLVTYTLFRPFENSGGTIGILTTAFLSGIALYFSTERPEPRRITTIDLIFLWYYSFTGICIAGIVISLGFGEGVYTVTTATLQWLLPISVVGGATFIGKQIKANPSRIRLSQNL